MIKIYYAHAWKQAAQILESERSVGYNIDICWYNEIACWFPKSYFLSSHWRWDDFLFHVKDPLDAPRQFAAVQGTEFT